MTIRPAYFAMLVAGDLIIMLSLDGREHAFEKRTRAFFDTLVF